MNRRASAYPRGAAALPAMKDGIVAAIPSRQVQSAGVA
jgi:hypothetical protein